MRLLKYLILVPALLSATVEIPVGTESFTGLTLEEFGPATQTNRTLQPENRFSENVPLRTNDFQPLQVRNATSREGIRMGYFYVNQGTTGAGLVLPSSQSNTTEAITTPTNALQLVVASTETNSYRILTSNPTTQSFLINYSVDTDPPPATFESNRTITDFQIIGNAFHDYRYVNLTPQISFTGGTITEVTTNGDNKFRVTMSTGQVLLLYFENTTDPVTLFTNISRTQLFSPFPFTGFLRVAAIQPAAVPLLAATTTAEFNPYATAIINQTAPVTPIAMFMLWPARWTTLVAPQIRTNLLTPTLVPDCDLLADILPVLARTDLSTALSYQQQLQNDDSFVTLFNMLAASKLSSEIALYQAFITPVPTITPTAAAIEATFDAFRTLIPITADIAFLADQYSWTYTCLNNLTNPLIIFPAYKRLSTGTPIAGFGYNDPIKGLLIGGTAVSNTITFSEDPAPTFWTDGSFFPTTLRFSGSEINALQSLFPSASEQLITSTDVVGVGQEIYQIAYTALAEAFILQQLGNPSSIQATTEALINRVKISLRQWLVTHLIPDFFVSDTLTGGICTVAGMGGLNAETASGDNSNALYSNHHLQYGYFLGALAFVIEWDDLTNHPNPFITETIQLTQFTFTLMKSFTDMLWRDARNFNTLDPQLPFNRHGNPWEGHSTSNGILYTVLPQGRFQERFGEDFNSWAAVNQYARAILRTPALTTAQKVGMQQLADFSLINMKMTATSGELVFQDSDWLYTAPYATSTLTVGQVFDTQTLATTTLQPGTPCQVLGPR